MDCNKVREKLMLYSKNELPPAERTELIEHIENCRECKADLKQLRQMDKIVHTAIKTEPAPDFNADIYQPDQGINYWKYAAVAATIIIFVSMFILNRNQPEQINRLQWDDKGLYELIELQERLDYISANSENYYYSSRSEFEAPQNTIEAILKLDDNLKYIESLN